MSLGRFGSSPSPFGGDTGDSNNAQTQTGPDLAEIQTEVSYTDIHRSIQC